MADIYRKNADSEHAADYGYGTNRPVQADISSSNAPNKPSRSGLATGALALLGLLLKFKGLALTFASTFVSAVLWAQYFGWWAFGIGFVLLILIHETGHLVVARALRLPVGLPVLIPFLGAFVTMNQRPKTVAEEAQMAVGGPVLGTIASGACYLGYLAAPTTYWGSLLGGLAYFGFLINLFNLVPVTPLDGGEPGFVDVVRLELPHRLGILQRLNAGVDQLGELAHARAQIRIARAPASHPRARTRRTPTATAASITPSPGAASRTSAPAHRATWVAT